MASLPVSEANSPILMRLCPSPPFSAGFSQEMHTNPTQATRQTNTAPPCFRVFQNVQIASTRPRLVIIINSYKQPETCFCGKSTQNIAAGTLAYARIPKFSTSKKSKRSIFISFFWRAAGWEFSLYLSIITVSAHRMRCRSSCRSIPSSFERMAKSAEPLSPGLKNDRKKYTKCR